MTPEIRAWRESFIRYCALRLRYRRAWQTGQANICDLAALLGKVEDAGETCRLLAPDEENFHGS